MEGEGRKLRVGVVGLGQRGLWHAQAYTENPHSTVRAVCDADPVSVRRFVEPRGLGGHLRLADMLAGERLDAVSIAVPTGLHKVTMETCLDAGLHVLLETPLTARLSEAESLVRLAAKKNVIAAIGYLDRFNPALELVKELIRNRALGEIHAVVSTRLGTPPPETADGNVVLDLVTHDLDCLGELFDDPLEVEDAQIDLEAAQVDLAIGAIGARIEVAWARNRQRHTLSISGARRHCFADLLTQRVTLDDHESLSVATGDPLARMIDAFLTAVCTGQQGRLATSSQGLDLLVTAQALGRDRPPSPRRLEAEAFWQQMTAPPVN